MVVAAAANPSAALRSAVKSPRAAVERVTRALLADSAVRSGKKGSVGECLQPRCVVGHDVGRSRDVETPVAVVVGSLVLTSYVAQASGRTIVGYGTAGDPGHGWGIVGSREDRGVPDVMGVGDQGGLGQDASVFKVAVCDAALRVVPGDQVVLHVR